MNLANENLASVNCIDLSQSYFLDSERASNLMYKKFLCRSGNYFFISSCYIDRHDGRWSYDYDFTFVDPVSSSNYKLEALDEVREIVM